MDQPALDTSNLTEQTSNKKTADVMRVLKLQTIWKQFKRNFSEFPDDRNVKPDKKCRSSYWFTLSCTRYYLLSHAALTRYLLSLAVLRSIILSDAVLRWAHVPLFWRRPALRTCTSYPTSSCARYLLSQTRMCSIPCPTWLCPWYLFSMQSRSFDAPAGVRCYFLTHYYNAYNPLKHFGPMNGVLLFFGSKM